jgi:predicted ester cyclase
VGRHELAGIPPSGNALDVKAVAIHRIENGRLAEHWSATDSATLFQQLGVITLPPPPAGDAR